MKKEYVRPLMEREEADIEQMLASSLISSDNGIGYGGVDEDGTLDPEVKEDDWSLWED